MAILDLVNIAAMTVQTKASLTNGQQALVSGYASANDGGGGTFYWEAGSSTATDSGTVFAADEGGTGRWKRIYSSPLNVRWFGAKGDGAASEDTALGNALSTARASNQLAVHVPRGVYRLSAPLDIGGVSSIGDGQNASIFQAKSDFNVNATALLYIDDGVVAASTPSANSSYRDFQINGFSSGLGAGTAPCLLLKGD